MHLKNATYLSSVLKAVSLWLGLAVLLSAQNDIVPLWPDGAPGSENWKQKEAEYLFHGQKELRNVVKPGIIPYLPTPDRRTGTAVVVAPGGGFNHLAWENEGTMVAEWLQSHGVAAFVLKYRLIDSGTDQEFAQAQAAATGRGRGAGQPGRGAGAPGRGGNSIMDNPVVNMSAIDSRKAIEIVRSRAAEWHIDPAKVGIMGFSAGGWAAITTAIEHSASDRPSFVGAIYTCCFNSNNTVNGSNLKVPADAPPLFLLHANDDGISASSPSLLLAWKAAGKPAELHTYVAGGHGFGMAKHNRPTDGWIERFGDWLRYQELMK